MINKYSMIEQIRHDAINQMQYEVDRHCNYNQWYDSFKSFRKSLEKLYVKIGSINGKMYRTRVVTLPSGDVIDHHIISYLSPLNICCKGWGGKNFLLVINLHNCLCFLRDIKLGLYM